MTQSFQIPRAAKGVLVGIVISLVLTLLLSLVYYLTPVQESAIYSLVITGLSVLIASFYIAFQAGSRGIYYGLAIGIGFFLLTIIIFYIFYEGNFAWLTVLEKLGICLVSGLIGGTIGAVLKK